MAKFLRVYALSVEVDSGNPTPVPYPVAAPGNGISVSTNPSNTANITIRPPYTVEFYINRNGTSVAQEATFRIYGLDAQTRKAIQKDQYRPDIIRAVQFRAGYYTPAGSAALPMIFNGQIKTAYSWRNAGESFVTEIQAFDGGFYLLNTSTNRVQGPGRRVDDTIRDLADQFSAASAKAVVGNFPAVNKRSEVLMGNTWELIQRKSDGNAILDNGQIKALNPWEVLAGDITVLSADTGLIGSPRRQEHLLNLTTLFEPRLTVWQMVSLESQTVPEFNGDYKILSLTHHGVISDAIGGDCTTVVGLQYGIDNPTLVGGDYLR